MEEASEGFVIPQEVTRQKNPERFSLWRTVERCDSADHLSTGAFRGLRGCPNYENDRSQSHVRNHTTQKQAE
jgi:hypothetical protein